MTQNMRRIVLASDLEPLKTRMAAVENAPNLASVNSSITSLQSVTGGLAQRLEAQETGIDSFSVYKSLASRAAKIPNPVLPVNAAIGVSLLGINVTTMEFSTQVKAAILELQQWAATVSANIFVSRLLMKSA